MWLNNTRLYAITKVTIVRSASSRFAARIEATGSFVTSSRLHRIDYQATVGRFSLDDASETSIQDLARLGAIEVEKRVNFDVINRRFLNGIKAIQFAPLNE
jgi:hypothetical protein